MRHAAEQQFNARLRVLGQALNARSSPEPTSSRLGKALLTAAGVGIGLAGALGVTRFLRAMLYGVSPFDPVSFVAVTVVLATIGCLASYIPAIRAARVDPIDALRQE